MRVALGVVAISLAVTIAAIAGASSRQEGPDPPKLDCGTDKQGSKVAFHQFMGILREGDEAKVRAVLEDGHDFAWLSAGTGEDGERPHIYQRRPNDAARAVARHAGLPIVIERFFNVDKPSRTTDAGFEGTWGNHALIGKGAINCIDGAAIVLSVAVRKNHDP